MLHSLKVAQLLRSAACLHTNQSRSYLNYLVLRKADCNFESEGNKKESNTHFRTECEKSVKIMNFEVSTAVLMKIQVSWDFFLSLLQHAPLQSNITCFVLLNT